MSRTGGKLAQFALMWIVTTLLGCATDKLGPDGQLRELRYEDFELADRDYSGKLDRQEVKASFPDWVRHFERIDTDDSGYISWSEAKAAGQPILAMPNSPRK